MILDHGHSEKRLKKKIKTDVMVFATCHHRVCKNKRAVKRIF